MALLVVLERLSPAQRVAFVLHDVFGLAFEEVAEIVGRTPAAVRQLAARARRDVGSGVPRFEPTAADQRAALDAFVRACAEGDAAALVHVLAPDVVLRGDGGGRVPALRAPVAGADAVAQVLLGWRLPHAVEPALVNGAPGLVLRDAQDVLSVVALTVRDGVITAIDVVRNPDKLRGVVAP
ncbi:hypothetical protein GCM10025864_08630 [Luteimicrobium album]|uniref:RNA polymerase sigma factor 70 region 4 type 2 domain-containing protein n=1 Tax=Luteimicrobium album TaxID=1054550 RepID=A0ABQ6HZY7_9MICO|nr:sigma factor-like helix-turn-helix DNA-binding protein [Luteimicrobium album]GMA23104.1 hypothetical protein GCM10025864_08630 [Luteimicrobium album]